MKPYQGPKILVSKLTLLYPDNPEEDYIDILTPMFRKYPNFNKDLCELGYIKCNANKKDAYPCEICGGYHAIQHVHFCYAVWDFAKSTYVTPVCSECYHQDDSDMFFLLPRLEGYGLYKALITRIYNDMKHNKLKYLLPLSEEVLPFPELSISEIEKLYGN